MEKQIIEKGYVTYALTNEANEIYGYNANHYINWRANPVEMAHTFYWSEVYCEREGAHGMLKIIRKGKMLLNPTHEELDRLFKQSKINLN